MIEKIIILSLIITAVHVSMREGMIFGFMGVFLRRSLPAVMRSPLFECLTCMGGLYGFVLHAILWGVSISMIPVIIAVIGLNSIIDKYIGDE